MSATTDAAYLAVEEALLGDADDDVTATEEGLRVRGTRFAFRDGDDLVVDLPEWRARDLIDRGVAGARAGDSGAKGTWVAVGDATDWVELATEAHQFVGEPAVGRDS